MKVDDLIGKWNIEIANLNWYLETDSTPISIKNEAKHKLEAISSCLADLKKLNEAIGSKVHKCPLCNGRNTNEFEKDRFICATCGTDWHL